MGWFHKDTGFEIHEKALLVKLNNIFHNTDVPELRKLCKNLIGSFPKKNMILCDSKGNQVYQFGDSITRGDYEKFYVHYQGLGEVNDIMLAKYLAKRNLLSPHDEDFVYVTTHNRDEKSNNDENEEKSMDESVISMDSILWKLEKDFEPEKLQSEDHLQAQIIQFVKAKFPNSNVQREQPLKNVRGNIDIVVDGKFAIEVKVPNSRTELRNLTAQLEEYKEEYPEICAVILDNKQLKLTNEIKSYVEKYKTKLGIESVILTGKKRG